MIVGVLGGGQLGRMLALAGYPLGLRFRFLDPDPHCPAGRVGELHVGAYDDERALEKFARAVDVVTYEFENVPARAARWLTDHVPVFPPEGALATAQDRIAEKACFELAGIETARHEAVDTLDGLRIAAERVGVPCVLKTRRMGYDGKGQAVIRSPDQLVGAWESVVGGGGGGKGKAGLILEAFIPFKRELSMLGVRGRDGSMAFYPPTQNVHVGGILARSTAPAPGCDEAACESMRAAVGRVMERLGYVGVLGVEFFDMGGGGGGGGGGWGGGRVVANEMAPRVHNSGHWTIEGAECSQFENHVRAVAGLPLGSTAPRGHSIMLNVIGGDPDMPALLGIPGAHVHMYDKPARPGRKLGHVTVCGSDVAGAERLAGRAMGALRNC